MAITMPNKKVLVVLLLGVVGLAVVFVDLDSTVASTISLRRLQEGTQTGKMQTEKLENGTTIVDCLTPEMNGTWELVSDVEKEAMENAAFCCGMRWDHYLLHPKECGPGSHERLNSHEDFRANIQADGKQYLTHFDVPACQVCQDRRGFQERYHWEAPNVLPSKFDAKDFCSNVLGQDTKLLMIGDSTMSQASGVLMNALMGTECGKHVTFAMSDTLIGERLGRWNRGREWHDLVQEYDPDVVVISAGAHIFGEDNFDRVFETVMKELEEVKQTRPHLKFIWKTQSAGGPCSDDIASKDAHPFKVAREMLDWTDHKFQHDKFFDRDARVIAALQKKNIPFIDMRMTYSRTDAHLGISGDCLHFCVEPGPLEVFPRLLHHVLKESQKGKPVSQCI